MTELQHSTDIKGSLALYIYDENGFHRGPQYFRKHVKYPSEEITSAQAHNRAFVAVSKGLEVRITDSGDMLVFHAKDGKILYPENPAKFWEECE